MNHQPFEAWLLDDKVLTLAEKRDLDSHLRECKTCSALAETGLALRSARVVAPRAGFATRFQHRLAAQKVAERRHRLWGLIALLVSGAGLLAWFIAPLVLTIASNPVEWLISIASYFLYLFSSLQAIGEVIGVFVRILPGFLPPYAWMVILSALSGIGLLWVVSIWRFARRPQGVLA
jgi:hypothetical protein